MKYFFYISEDWLFQNFTYQEINNQVHILVSVPLTLHFVTAVKLDVIPPNRFCSCLTCHVMQVNINSVLNEVIHYTFFVTQTEIDKVMLDYIHHFTHFISEILYFNKNDGGGGSPLEMLRRNLILVCICITRCSTQN